MQTHDTSQAGGWVLAAVWLMSGMALQAANPAQPKILEAQRRMDFTGAGSYHRIGLLRELANTQRHQQRAAAAAPKQKAGPAAENARVAKS